MKKPDGTQHDESQHVIYLNSAEFPNQHFSHFTIVSEVERQAKKCLDHQVQVHQKRRLLQYLANPSS